MGPTLMGSHQPSLLRQEHEPPLGLLPPRGGHRGCVMSHGAGGRVLPQILSMFIWKQNASHGALRRKHGNGAGGEVGFKGLGEEQAQRWPKVELVHVGPVKM